MTVSKNLLYVDPYLYQDSRLSQKVILEWFSYADAYWMLEGKAGPNNPHAELSSGKCSNGYFNCPELLKHPNICEILGHQLAQKLLQKGIDNVDWVISSAYSAITFGHEVAKQLGAVFANVEKDPADPKKKRMLWQRMTIPEGANVLQIEELITTSDTFREVRRAVKQGNAEPVNFLPIVGTLVHRPPKLPANYGDCKVIALIEKEIWAVEPKCPLCKAGSPRYQPKTHWKELTGKS